MAEFIKVGKVVGEFTLVRIGPTHWDRVSFGGVIGFKREVGVVR